MNQTSPVAVLKQEVMLLINERLFQRSLLTREMYELAKVQIVAQVNLPEGRANQFGFKNNLQPKL